MAAKFIIFSGIFLILVLYAYKGITIFLFSGGEVIEAVLFSPIEGHLTFQGKPAAGAKLRLWLAWKDKEGEFFSYTADEQGFFQIPKHVVSYKQNPLAQLVISQEINVEYQGNTYEIWVMSKRDPAEFTELGGRPENLTCELTTDLRTVRGFRSLGGIACSWHLLKRN